METSKKLLENKHNSHLELQEPKYTESVHNHGKCGKISRSIVIVKEEIVRMMDLISITKEENLKVCDFREMAKVQESKRGTVKRLQGGPREIKSKDEFGKKTGIILRRLVMRLAEMIPEMQMEKACIPKEWTKTTPTLQAMWKSV